MNKKYITFTANDQKLIKTGGIDHYADNIVAYIGAHFDLGTNWQGFDSVKAIWFTRYEQRESVLDTEGNCDVPTEVLALKAVVMVNLVGSIAENDVLTARLTTYPIEAVTIDADARISAGASQPITPSEYEQFVATVKADADRAEDAKDSARVYAGNALSSAQNALVSETNASTSETNAHTSEVNAKASEDNAKISELSASASATEAEEWADKAEQSAGQSGYMFFYIDDDGYIVYERTANVDVDFIIDEDGYICVEAVA